jgi:ankyrin repeat protein
MSAEFIYAIKSGDRATVERLLVENPALIHVKEDGVSPVLLAAYHNEPEIAELLAEKTVTLNIFEAAATGKTATIIRLLARDPELINAYSEDGYQPLGLASFFGHSDTAEFLIKAGATVNSYSNNTQHATPLQSAVAGQHLNIVRLLLANGADPNCRNSRSQTPLHAAAQNGDMDMIRVLIFGGSDLESRDDDNKLPVDLALDAEHEEAARLLMEGITRRNRTRRPTVPRP